MSTETSNLKLTKPLETENYDINIFNENFDKIDDAVNKNTTQLNAIKKKTDKFSEDNNGKLLYNGAKVGETEASKINLSAISGMSASNVQAGIAELFQCANNGKQYMVDAIGNPLVKTDTFATMKSRINTLKNTMANNLKAKGVTATGTETLNSLISKIVNISLSSLGGKKYATGIAVPGSFTTYKDNYSANAYGYPITLTGIGFIPRFIIVSVGGYITLYDGTNSKPWVIMTKPTSRPTGSTSSECWACHLSDNTNIAVNSSKVTIPAMLSTSATWFAFE